MSYFIVFKNNKYKKHERNAKTDEYVENNAYGI